MQNAKHLFYTLLKNLHRYEKKRIKNEKTRLHELMHVYFNYMLQLFIIILLINGIIRFFELRNNRLFLFWAYQKVAYWVDSFVHNEFLNCVLSSMMHELLQLWQIRVRSFLIALAWSNLRYLYTFKASHGFSS